MHADGDRHFWFRHVRIGNLLSLVVLAMIAVYTALTPEGPNRPLLWACLGAAALLTTITLLLPWRAIFARHGGEPILVAWSFVVIVFIMVGTAVDGGVDSPLSVLMVLPVIFAAMAYRPAYVIAFGVIVVLGRGIVGALTQTLDGSYDLLRTGTMIAIAVMCALIAASHRQQGERLADAVARLDELAHRDELTGCLNRRAFEQELERCFADDGPLGLLLFDVDDFKRVNDTQGHLAGDALLVRLAELLRANVRADDAVARIGGDEFAVILPRADAAAMDRAALRFRTAFEDLQVLDGVTVSVGYAHSDDAGLDRERLIGLADSGMYDAKADQLVRSPDDPTTGVPALSVDRFAQASATTTEPPPV